MVGWINIMDLMRHHHLIRKEEIMCNSDFLKEKYLEGSASFFFFPFFLVIINLSWIMIHTYSMSINLITLFNLLFTWTLIYITSIMTCIIYVYTKEASIILHCHIEIFLCHVHFNFIFIITPLWLIFFIVELVQEPDLLVANIGLIHVT